MVDSDKDRMAIQTAGSYDNYEEGLPPAEEHVERDPVWASLPAGKTVEQICYAGLMHGFVADRIDWDELPGMESLATMSPDDWQSAWEDWPEKELSFLQFVCFTGYAQGLSDGYDNAVENYET